MSDPPHTLATGVWGGEQVILEVGADRATLRLGCGQGEFAPPAALDSQGSFSAAGTLVNFGAGPSTSKETPFAVRYEGVVEGDRLTLSVRHGRSTETYRLQRGVQSKVIRCL